jgi:hypothetical protein
MDSLRFPLLAEQFDLLVNKSSKVLNRVEKRFKLELNSWSPFGRSFVVGKLRLNRSGEISYSVILLTFCAKVKTSFWGRAQRNPRPTRRTGSEDIGFKPSPQPPEILSRC